MDAGLVLQSRNRIVAKQFLGLFWIYHNAGLVTAIHIDKKVIGKNQKRRAVLI